MGSSKLQDKKKFAKEVVLASVDIWETVAAAMPTTAAALCLQWGGLGFAQRAMVQMVGEGYTQRSPKKSVKNDVGTKRLESVREPKNNQIP